MQDNAEMAEAFNVFFQSVFPQKTSTAPLPSSVSDVTHSMDDIIIDVYGIILSPITRNGHL